MDFFKFDSDKFSRKDFEFLIPLGRNSLSRVEKVLHLESNTEYALKIYEKSQIDTIEKLDQILTEKEMFEQCSHPGVLKIIGHFTDKEFIYFVIEYCENGDFEKFLSKFSAFPFELVRFYAAEITSVLTYLHTSGLAHGNLKPRNILIYKDFHIKITDFRNTKHPSQYKKKLSTLVSADYVSPELLDEGESGMPSDLWALGCIIYQMFTGSPPFVKNTLHDTFEEIRKGVVKFPLSIPPFAADLVQSLLLPDPLLRIGVSDVDELKSHIFFQGINLDKVFSLAVPDYSHQMSPDSEVESKVILEEAVKKKSGFMFKKRVLRLTQEPSLVYFDPDRKVEGKIEMSPQLKVEIKNKKDFALVTPKNSYVFRCCDGNAENWAKAIRDVILKVYGSSGFN